MTGNIHRLWITPFVSAVLMFVSEKIFWNNAFFWNSMAMVVFFRTLIGLSCASLLLLVCCYNQKNLIKLTLPLRYLGTISFGIYLWHLSIIMALKRLDWLSGERALPVVIGLTLIFATLSWIFFEKPITQRFARKLPPPSQ